MGEHPDNSSALDALQNLRDLRARVAKHENVDEEVRRALHLEARGLMLDLETDGEILTRTLFGLWEKLAIDIAIDMGLFKVLVDNKEPQPADKLAEACNAEPLLTERVLRCLGAYGAVDITSVNGGSRYSANKVSRLYASEKGVSHMEFVGRVLHPGWMRTPAKLKGNQYRSLTSATHTTLADIHGKYDSDFWGLLTPKEVGIVNVFMPHYNTDHKDWLEVYPAQERLIKDAKASISAVLLVDVGGAGGSQAASFCREFPKAPGRVIVQDLAHAVRSPNTDVETMAQDFFQPQAVKGARAYYLRWICHDWGYDNCVKILSHLRDAMEPGYSKVLINEFLMPDRDASMFMTSADLNMMHTFGGEERSEYRHREYIEAAGLKITGIWDLKDGVSEAVIECEVA